MPEKTPRFRLAMKRTLGAAMLCWAYSASAAFVSPADSPPERDSAAVFEKREVNAEVVRRALWKVTGQGVFEAYVNGRRVGDDFLKPGFTESGKCRHVYSYDVTELLDCAKGATNILSAVVAAGWWCDEMMTAVRETPWQLGKKIAFCGRLEIEYASGKRDVRETDPSWRAAYTGPVVAAGIYEGEVYDARRKVEALKPVEINREFSGELRPAAAKVVLRRDLTLKPVDIYVTRGAEGVAPGAFGKAIVVRRAEEDGAVRLMPGELLVVDFGQNAAAVPSFEVFGDSGTTVTLLHAEMLNEANGEKSRGNDGPSGTPYLASLRKAKAMLSYTLGDGKNDFMPRHTFFGYRYLSVTTTGPVRFSSFRSVPVSSVTQAMERGMMKTGNARVNRLIENIRWGVLSNYLSVPTDCPQRDERLGWTADTQVFMDSAAYLLDTYDFLSKYLADLRDAQFPDGLFQCFVPNVRHVFSHKASCGWTDACILIPYRLWKWYGRREIVDVSWPSMVRYMDFLDSQEDPYNPKHHGDWLSFEHTLKKKDGSDAEAPEPRQVQMLNAVFRVWTARLMKEMAEETGRGEDARRFSETERRHGAVFAEKYLGADGCLKEEYRGQCNDLYMLKLGLCGNGAAVEATKRDLVENVKAHGNRLQTGFLGTPLLLPVLTFDVGNPELAYTLLLQDKFPSWLYSVDQGATTVWERWNGYTKEKGFGPVVMNSFNHYAYGCVLEWLFAAAAGIRQAPGGLGWKHFVLAPLPDRRIGSVDASFVSPEGKISSSWRYADDGGWTWSFTIPDGTTAAVSLPGGEPRTYGPGSYTLNGTDAAALALPCPAAAKASPVAESFSATKWIYAPPSEDPPANAYLRLAFDVPKPVKSAYVYACREKAKGAWLDGSPIEFKGRRPEFAKVRGSWQAATVDLKPMLAQGRHVLAFRLDRHPQKCYGMILRGEIVFEDGERRELLSCARQVKASGREETGWLEPGFDDSAWKAAVELGDPRLPPWSNYGDTMRMYASPEENARYEEFMRTGDLSPEQERQLLAEPDSPNVRIVYSGDTPGIEVNGRVLPPYTHAHMDMAGMAERERYFCHLRDLGMNIFGLKDFRRNRFEPEEGQYDFSSIDASMRRMLALNPDALFMLSYGNGKRLPKGWEDRNPDELVGYALPSKNMEPCSYITNAKVPSFASQVYRDSERKFWKAFGDYAKSKPWGRRIIGIHCGFGGSGDGMPTGAHCMPDTGKRMTEAFRRYLQEKYATDADLQRAWGDDAVTRATAAVPDRKLRAGSGAYLRNLSDPRDRRLADYYDCYHKTFEEFILDFCASVKAAFPGRIVGAYHGYSVLAYTPEGNTARIGRLLRSQDLDYFFATTRGYNLTDGLHRNIASICRQFGKLTSIEGDVRTHVSLPIEASDKWRCKTPEETRATFSKIVANALVDGSGWHMVDFGVYTARRTPWFDIPDALEPFATALREWRRAWDRPVHSANETAVVLDMEQLWKQGSPVWGQARTMTDNLQTYPLQALNFSGFPYDLLTPEGYLATKDRYKAVVFLALYETTPDLRRQVRAKLAADGSTAFWCFAPGLAEATGFSTNAMHELTGMDLDFAHGIRPYVMQDKTGEKSALFEAIEGWKYVPRVFSRDAACEVSATWKNDGTAAIAKKRLEDGTTSVFVGMPPHKSAKWAALLADAGCTAVTKPGFMVRRGNGYLEVFSGKGTSVPPESLVQKGQIDQSGRVEVRPVKNVATLTDVFSGEVFQVQGGSVSLTADKPHTWLFREGDL